MKSRIIYLVSLLSFGLVAYPGKVNATPSAAFFKERIQDLFQSEIAQKVKSVIIDQLGVEESRVTPEASFTGDLGADSLDAVELIMALEEEFDVSIPDEVAENIVTVGQAISWLEKNAK